MFFKLLGRQLLTTSLPLLLFHSCLLYSFPSYKEASLPLPLVERLYCLLCLFMPILLSQIGKWHILCLYSSLPWHLQLFLTVLTTFLMNARQLEPVKRLIFQACKQGIYRLANMQKAALALFSGIESEAAVTESLLMIDAKQKDGLSWKCHHFHWHYRLSWSKGLIAHFHFH